MTTKNVKKAKKIFDALPDKEKEIALRYLENVILGKHKENATIKQRLGLQDTAD